MGIHVKELVSPKRVIASLVVTIYATVLLYALPRSSIWPYFAGAATLFAIHSANVLEYPIVAIWPAFPGVLLTTTCIGGLFGNVPRSSLVPVTHSRGELWVALLIGSGLVCWAIRTARTFKKHA